MLVVIALIIAGDLFGLLSLAPAIPVMAVIVVLIRFLDELYLRSDFHPRTHALSKIVKL